MSASTSSAAETGGDLLGCSPNEAKILEAMDSVCSTVARLIQWADRVIVDGKTFCYLAYLGWFTFLILPSSVKNVNSRIIK